MAPRPNATAPVAGGAIRIRGGPHYGDSFYCRDLLFSRCAVRRSPRSQHTFLEVAAGFRYHRRALEDHYPPSHCAAALLCHHACHAVGHVAAKRGSTAGERREFHDDMVTSVYLPCVTD